MYLYFGVPGLPSLFPGAPNTSVQSKQSSPFPNIVLFPDAAFCLSVVPLSLSACMYVSGFSVYSGHQSILVPPLELESNASLWLAAVSQYKVRVTFCSYSVMEMCTKGLGSQTEALRVSLSVVTGEATSCSIFFHKI